jgi:hypothetical protein
MDAELIVVEGPLLGTRYALGADEVRIGPGAFGPHSAPGQH